MNTKIKNIASNISFPLNVVDALMNTKYHGDIVSDLRTTIRKMEGDVIFSLPPQIKEQYLHSDCYMLAEFLLYALHNEFTDVHYVHVTQTLSIHGLVRITDRDKVVFVDAGGIYTSLDAALERYNLTPEQVTVGFQNSADIIDEENFYGVRKLTQLTHTSELVFAIADELDYGSGDLEDELMTNLVGVMLASHQQIQCQSGSVSAH